MKITRYAGSPESNPAEWLRINNLTVEPGPGSAYKITIEPIEVMSVPVVGCPFDENTDHEPNS